MKVLAAVLAAGIFVLGWLYLGYVHSYLDEEVQTTFFIKKFPTFQIEFHDIFANERDARPVPALTRNEKAMLADYCKYRFGETSVSDEALSRCARNTPAYLR